MKRIQLTRIILLMGLGIIAFSACEDQLLTGQQQTSRQYKTVHTPEGVNGYTTYPDGQRVVYPTIIEQTYIPSNDLFAHTKCLAWRISWPEYPAGTDPERIATIFNASNGALNSIHYLNNTHPQNTHKAAFSLYHNKLEAAIQMWQELDHRDVALMEDALFYKTDHSAKIIEGWVKERPSLFKSYWESSDEQEADYQAGDIFLFRLTDQDQYKYGGIRIVSLTPRIIEVYLAVPNY
jgi:hypothetical protein